MVGEQTHLTRSASKILGKAKLATTEVYYSKDSQQSKNIGTMIQNINRKILPVKALDQMETNDLDSKIRNSTEKAQTFL